MNNLEIITFTGIDAQTDLAKVKSLSEENKNIEWGILFSKNPTSNRYCSFDQIKNIAEELKGVRKSAHLCGGMVTQYLNGEEDLLTVLSNFDRIQINVNISGLSNKKTNDLLQIFRIANKPHIIQWNHNNELFIKNNLLGCKNLNILFDASGGAGKLPSSWPENIDDVFCGYAGGLSPENIDSELPKIIEIVSNKSFAIDMEGKIRNDNDWFDLEKIEIVLKKIKQVLNTQKKSLVF